MHEWWQWVLMIPLGGLGIGLVSAVLSILSRLAEKIMAHNERRLELQLKLKTAGRDNGDVLRMIEQLRKELAEMRDTATAYDLSIDSQLQNLMHRMEFLERQRIGSMAEPSAGADEVTQRIRS